ncbi:MAG: pyridoxamine 5'-phosphate oxidase family protein [Acidimicrobiales bacterium]
MTDSTIPAPHTGDLDPTRRSQVRRHRDRASYTLDHVHAILDEGFICHVACHDEGTTWIIPTAYGRRREELLLHGAAANHLFAAVAAGAQVAVTVTLVDGMVLARSTFSHSVNYRSVVIFGQATAITDPDAKVAALEAIVEHMLPGRTGEARPPTATEVRSTTVLSLPITEASAKIRTGPPLDGDGPDGELAVWAGTLPLRTVAGPPLDAPDLQAAGATRGPAESWATQPLRWDPAEPETP